jgi:hypothetical protein
MARNGTSVVASEAWASKGGREAVKPTASIPATGRRRPPVRAQTATSASK